MADHKACSDIEEIRQIKFSFCRGVDAHRWDDVADLWAEDGTADYGPNFGTLDGRENVRAFYRQLLENSSNTTLHTAANPTIELDGDTASGEWVMVTAMINQGQPPQWNLGRYFETYCRVDGAWKVQSMRAEMF
ncbi:MAG TPA: nuclear transport factor 2 family protein [Dehalococcoidia bacterium]|nr:nuclear transport factor 2 family protein [Dehalococcoidia bacterium]